MEVSIKLLSITRNQSLKDADAISDGTVAKSERVTYYRGSQEFDEYESRMKAMIPTYDKLPKNFMGPGALCSTGDATKLNQQIFKVLERYHRGCGSTAEIENAMSRVVADIRNTYTQMGFDPNEFTAKLVSDVYDIARMANVDGAALASWYQGRPIAQAHNGHNGNTRDWVYYDADLYYASEEMKGTLQDIAHKIGAKYGVTSLELSTSYPDGDLRQKIYSSYNTAINHRARNDCLIGNILDESMPPPQGLKFFYMDKQGGDPYVAKLPSLKNDPYDAFDSFLSVSYGDWSFTGRVPVRMDGTLFPASVNMFDVVHRGTGGRVPGEISSFLQNIDFFSTVQSGRYLRSHPRKY